MEKHIFCFFIVKPIGVDFFDLIQSDGFDRFFGGFLLRESAVGGMATGT